MQYSQGGRTHPSPIVIHTGHLDTLQSDRVEFFHCSQSLVPIIPSDDVHLTIVDSSSWPGTWVVEGRDVLPAILRRRISLNLVIVGLSKAVPPSEGKQAVSHAVKGYTRARVVHVGTRFPLLGIRVVALHAGVVRLPVVAPCDVDHPIQDCSPCSRAWRVHVRDGTPLVFNGVVNLSTCVTGRVTLTSHYIHKTCTANVTNDEMHTKHKVCTLCIIVHTQNMYVHVHT